MPRNKTNTCSTCGFYKLRFTKLTSKQRSLFVRQAQRPHFGHNLCAYVRPCLGATFAQIFFAHPLFFCCGFFQKKKCPKAMPPWPTTRAQAKKQRYRHICRSVRYFAHLPQAEQPHKPVIRLMANAPIPRPCTTQANPLSRGAMINFCHCEWQPRPFLSAPYHPKGRDNSDAARVCPALVQ